MDYLVFLEFVMPAIEISAVLILLTVALLDSLLSVDNALVLAVVVEHLPRNQRARALRYGIFGAYIMRGLSLFFVSILVHFWPLKLVGALYLLYLGVSHFFAKESNGADGAPKKAVAGFWMTVLQVEWLDLTFSLDNILATVALAPRPDQLWIVITGVFISILAMRYVAGIFLKLLGRYPILKPTAYVLVIFIGLKLLISLVGIELGEVETFLAIAAIIFGAIAYERIQKSLSEKSTASAAMDER
jgi:YkoY family integral membrane protein